VDGAHRDTCPRLNCDCGIEFGRIQIRQERPGRWSFRVWMSPCVDPVFPAIYGPRWEGGIRWSEAAASRAAARMASKVRARLVPRPWQEGSAGPHLACSSGGSTGCRC